MNFNDWIKNNNKKILISNSNNFSNKIIKNYCIDFNTFINNTKVVTIEDILTILFMSENAKSSSGFNIISEGLSTTIVEYLLRKALKEETSDFIYDFIPKTSIGGKTHSEVYKALKEIRIGRVVNPNPRYESLNKLNYDYNSFLDKYKYYDYVKLLDFGIDYIYNHTKEEIILALGYGKNISLGLFDNLKLSYKEALFIELLEKTFNVKKDILSYTYEENEINNKFVKCYGIYNEVNFIVDKIINEKLNPSDINIYYTDLAYENYIRAIFERRGIDFRFNKALAIATNLIQLFRDIITFYKNDYRYEDLYNVVKNPIFTFDKIIEKNKLDSKAYNKPLKSFFDINRGNICNDKERYLNYIKEYKADNIKNDLFVIYFLSDLMKAADFEQIDILYSNIYELIKNYTYVNDEYISLKDKLDDLINVFNIMALINDGFINNLDYIESNIENLSYSEKEDDLAINVIKLSNYEIIDRKINFVLGLSSSQIKKKEVESAIFSDDEYKSLLDNNYHINLASNLNNDFTDILNKTFKSINKATIYFEYSCFDTIEFKPQAPSIFYLDKKGNEEEIYFTYAPDNQNYYIDKEDVLTKVKKYKAKKDQHLANTNNLKFVDASDKTLDLNLKVDQVVINESLDVEKQDVWSMSATGLGNLVTCPMCYSYQYLKFIPDLSFREYQSYSWLDALAKGNLFHHTLEYYSDVVFKDNLGFDEIEFNNAFDKAIEKAILEIPYPNEKIYEKEYKLNKEVAKNYIIKLHQFYDEEASLNRFYKNIGNELGFGKKYNIKSIIKGDYEININDNLYKTNYELSLNGSIDRLDGYLDGDVIHFLIIDYKTSKEDNLKGEIKEFTKIQHYIYALAVFDYFKEEKASLEKLFNHEINSCVIDNMEYHLPFSDKILKWTDGFEIKKFSNEIPRSKEEIVLPDKMKDAIGIVSLFRDGVNIDILYNELKKYYEKYKLKDPNKYSHYKHICRYEIDSSVEEDEDEEAC